MSLLQDNHPSRGRPPQLIQTTFGRWVLSKAADWDVVSISRLWWCPSFCAVVVTVTVMGFGIREALDHVPALPLPSWAILQTLCGILSPSVLAVKWIWQYLRSLPLGFWRGWNHIMRAKYLGPKFKTYLCMAHKMADFIVFLSHLYI